MPAGRRGPSIWIGRDGIVFDIFLLGLPWLYLLAILVWGNWFGPNVRPSWPIGDPHLYNWCVEHLPKGFNLAIVMFSLIRFAIHRRNLLVLIFVPVSAFLGFYVTAGAAFA